MSQDRMRERPRTGDRMSSKADVDRSRGSGHRAGQDAARDSGRDYSESDVEVVYRRGDWRSWDETIGWLRGDGMDDGELPQSHARTLLRELEELEDDRVAFTRDPHLAYQLLRSHH